MTNLGLSIFKQMISALIAIILTIGSQSVVFNPETVTVTYVIDGDTIVVESHGFEEKVRLVGIDAPELNGSAEPECFAIESQEYLRSLLTNKQVRLQLDSFQPAYDQYDRKLAYVLIDETDVNKLLIQEGFAKVYESIKSDRTEAYEAIQNIARENNLGLWGKCLSSE